MSRSRSPAPAGSGVIIPRKTWTRKYPPETFLAASSSLDNATPTPTRKSITMTKSSSSSAILPVLKLNASSDKNQPQRKDSQQHAAASSLSTLNSASILPTAASSSTTIANSSNTRALHPSHSTPTLYRDILAQQQRGETTANEMVSSLKAQQEQYQELLTKMNQDLNELIERTSAEKQDDEKQQTNDASSPAAAPILNRERIDTCMSMMHQLSSLTTPNSPLFHTLLSELHSSLYNTPTGGGIEYKEFDPTVRMTYWELQQKMDAESTVITKELVQIQERANYYELYETSERKVLNFSMNYVQNSIVYVTFQVWKEMIAKTKEQRRRIKRILHEFQVRQRRVKMKKCFSLWKLHILRTKRSTLTPLLHALQTQSRENTSLYNQTNRWINSSMNISSELKSHLKTLQKDKSDMEKRLNTLLDELSSFKSSKLQDIAHSTLDLARELLLSLQDEVEYYMMHGGGGGGGAGSSEIGGGGGGGWQDGYRLVMKVKPPVLKVSQVSTATANVVEDKKTTIIAAAADRRKSSSFKKIPSPASSPTNRRKTTTATTSTSPTSKAGREKDRTPSPSPSNKTRHSTSATSTLPKPLHTIQQQQQQHSRSNSRSSLPNMSLASSPSASPKSSSSAPQVEEEFSPFLLEQHLSSLSDQDLILAWCNYHLTRYHYRQVPRYDEYQQPLRERIVTQPPQLGNFTTDFSLLGGAIGIESLLQIYETILPQSTHKQSLLHYQYEEYEHDLRMQSLLEILKENDESLTGIMTLEEWLLSDADTTNGSGKKSDCLLAVLAKSMVNWPRLDAFDEEMEGREERSENAAAGSAASASESVGNVTNGKKKNSSSNNSNNNNRDSTSTNTTKSTSTTTTTTTTSSFTTLLTRLQTMKLHRRIIYSRLKSISSAHTEFARGFERKRDAIDRSRLQSFHFLSQLSSGQLLKCDSTKSDWKEVKEVMEKEEEVQKKIEELERKRKEGKEKSGDGGEVVADPIITIASTSDSVTITDGDDSSTTLDPSSGPQPRSSIFDITDTSDLDDPHRNKNDHDIDGGDGDTAEIDQSTLNPTLLRVSSLPMTDPFSPSEAQIYVDYITTFIQEFSLLYSDTKTQIERLLRGQMLWERVKERMEKFMLDVLVKRVEHTPVEIIDPKAERDYMSFTSLSLHTTQRLSSSGLLPHITNSSIQHENEVQRVECELQTDYTELCSVFRAYAGGDLIGGDGEEGDGDDEEEEDNSTLKNSTSKSTSPSTTLTGCLLLTSTGYEEFIRDLKLVSNKGIKQSTVDAVWNTVCAAGGGGNMDPLSSLTPSQFIEVLLRLSVLKYGMSCSDSLTVFLKQDVLKKAKKINPDLLRSKLRTTEYIELFRKHRKKLRKLFSTYASGFGVPNLCSQPLATPRHTLDLKDFVNILKFTKLYGAVGDGLPIEDIQTVFINTKRSEYITCDNPSCGIDSLRLNYGEFCESLTALAMYKNPDPFSPFFVRVDHFLTRDFLPLNK